MDAAMSSLFFDGMVGEEFEVGLDDDHEVDEDESSACAPYLARQMSCLGSRTPGVKDPLFRFGTGREGGWKTPSLGVPRQAFRSTYKQAIQGHKEFTHIQAARRLKALLLHVWIEWIIMVWLTRMVSGVNPEGGG